MTPEEENAVLKAENAALREQVTVLVLRGCSGVTRQSTDGALDRGAHHEGRAAVSLAVFSFNSDHR